MKGGNNGNAAGGRVQTEPAEPVRGADVKLSAATKDKMEAAKAYIESNLALPRARS